MISGTTAALAVVRSLGARGVPVIVADYEDHGSAAASRFVRDRMRLPHPEHDETGFVEGLLDRADVLDGAMLLPGSDEALVALAFYGERPAQPDYAESVYWIDIVRDVAFTVIHAGRDGTTPRGFVRPYARPHVFAVASARDPRPMFKRIAGPVRDVSSKIIRRGVVRGGKAGHSWM